MSDIAIRVENLGKAYRITSQRQQGKRYKTLQEELLGAPGRLWRMARGYGDGRETVWALKDVSLEVREGEVVGIIGRNGAGKTTLLKILCRITEPTEGQATVYGRVGSLLEVGTGFHPELTGRENVFLNGAILGMRRQEVRCKFDEIVAFAEVEQYIDTPVKRYSSGMQVRLAFAVAAHLEPEILLVDEVLAVGDVQFQRKCLGKMGDVAREGRTVLFVSHNMPAVIRLCPKAIALDKGRIVDQGGSKQVVEQYLENAIVGRSRVDLPPDLSKPMCLRGVTILDSHGEPVERVEMEKPFRVRVEYDVNQTVTGAHVICFIHTSEGINVFGSGDADCAPERLGGRQPGRYVGEFEVPAFLLGEGQYSIDVSLSVPFVVVYDRHSSVVGFEVFDSASQRRQWQHRRRPGILGIELPWHYDSGFGDNVLPEWKRR